MSDLHVILRTCQQSKLDKNLIDSGQKFSRICGDDRETMILKCVTSLVNSIQTSKLNVKLTVLDDHSDKKFLTKLKKVLSKHTQTTLINLEKEGYNHSAFEQFRLAAETDGLVYTVEDDYLHEENALQEMVSAFNYFTVRFRDNVMIFPFDCPFRYEQDKEEPTVLFYNGERYWRHVTRTTYTFLTHGSVIKNNFQAFKALALYYPHVLEDQTINRLYKKVIPNENESIIVFNPIPSLAYHLSYAEPAKINTKNLTWNDLWEK